MKKKTGPKPNPKRNWRNRRVVEIEPTLYDDFREAVSRHDLTFSGAVRALMQGVVEGRIEVVKAPHARRPLAKFTD